MMDLEMPIITTQVPAGNQIGNTSALTYFADYYPLKMRGDGQSAPYDGGMTFKFKAYGYISTISGPGTLTLNVSHITTQPATVVLGTTGAFTPPGSLSNAFWCMEGYVVFNQTGPGGKAAFFGKAEIQNAANAAFLAGIVNAGTGATPYVAVNTNQPNPSLKIGAQWQTQNAGNVITLSFLHAKRVA